MNVIYIGSVINQDQIKYFPETSIAANNFQLGMLGGIINGLQGNISIYSVPAKKSWPSSKSNIIQKMTKMAIDNKHIIEIIPFVNIKFLKEVSIQINLFKRLYKKLKRFNNEPVIIMSYNGDGRISGPILFLKHFFKFDYICIVVDPPEYKGTTKRKGVFWNTLYRINRQKYMKAVNSSNALIVLNKNFIKLNHITKPFIKIEGGLSIDVIDRIASDSRDKNSDVFNIVFTGTLHEHSGVIKLLDQFETADIEKCVLHIYGDGVFADDVTKKCKSSTKMFYHGNVSFEDAIKAQKSADLIICPNLIDHPINQVAFPSKLLEYLGSHTPIMATKLKSIGSEYDDCVFFYDDRNDSFKLTLEGIIHMSPTERKLKAENAYELAKKEKDWGSQSKKIMAILEELVKK